MNKLEDRIRELVVAAGNVWEAWLETLPEDDRAIIVGETEDGALPGVRLIVGDDRRMPHLALLLRTRSGDVETVGEVELTRG